MSSVLTATDDIVVVNAETLQTLKELAATAPLKRSRLCLHRTSEDPIQEMVIAFARDSYVRVHRHRNKSESFHILAGSLEVVFFDDEGRETRRIQLGEPGTGRGPAIGTVLGSLTMCHIEGEDRCWTITFMLARIFSN